jgi:hypothetical protein
MTDSKPPEQRNEQDDQRRGAVPEGEKIENKRLTNMEL